MALNQEDCSISLDLWPSSKVALRFQKNAKMGIFYAWWQECAELHVARLLIDLFQGQPRKCYQEISTCKENECYNVVLFIWNYDIKKLNCLGCDKTTIKGKRHTKVEKEFIQHWPLQSIRALKILKAWCTWTTLLAFFIGWKLMKIFHLSSSP